MSAQKDAWISIDADGFLEHPGDWTEEVAAVLAARAGIEALTKEQFDILKFLRTYYEKHRFFPIIRSICKNVRQPQSCIADQFDDPVMAWKIAGLPNPGEEVNGFRSWDPLGY